MSVRVPISATSRDLLVAVGILSKSDTPAYLQTFLEKADLVLNEVRQLVEQGQWDLERAGVFQQLLVDTAAQVMCHPIIAGNNYLKRFGEGVTFEQARHELQQFSVFALQFDVAQAKLVANAPTRDAYEERLRVLLNEKGIPYKNGFEGELTGKWSKATVHFTWLQNMAGNLNLKFEEIGKIWIGQPGTRAFVEATFKYYASTDQSVALGASFGIENWAAGYLWKPWIAGMKKLNETLEKPVNLGYLTYHDAEEEHHAQATVDELFENFKEPWFDSDKFLEGALAILNEGVQPYYESQLASMPDRDDTWPAEAVSPRSFDPASLPRLETSPVTA